MIQRLEDYLGIGPDGNLTPPSAPSSEDYDVDMEGLDEATAVFEPFKDLFKRRFLWYYDAYLQAIAKAKTEVVDGLVFPRMPFEGGGNTMDGRFNYTELEKRLRNIKKVLDDEPLQWARQGAEDPELKDATVTVNLRRQFEQIVEYYKQHGMAHNVELENGNPYVWILNYIGRPMTPMDGALCRIKIHLSPKFPEEQPRVTFLTKLFHHRIAQDGTPCYWPSASRREDMKTHLDTIMQMLEEESPPYDPRTLVHPEASKLYWGSADDKKKYRTRLRRSIQASTE